MSDRPPVDPPVVPHEVWERMALASVFPGRCRWWTRRHRWEAVPGLDTYRRCERCGALRVLLDPTLERMLRKGYRA